MMLNEHTHTLFGAIKMVSVCHIQAVNKRKMIIVTMAEKASEEAKNPVHSHAHTPINEHQLFARCQHLILIGQLAIGQIGISFSQ